MHYRKAQRHVLANKCSCPHNFQSCDWFFETASQDIICHNSDNMCRPNTRTHVSHLHVENVTAHDMRQLSVCIQTQQPYSSHVLMFPLWAGEHLSQHHGKVSSCLPCCSGAASTPFWRPRLVVWNSETYQMMCKNHLNTFNELLIWQLEIDHVDWM